MDLDSVAGELYALPPEEFTSARDARAAEARSSGDRELSASIKKLRRPTAGAWLANLLARERPEQVASLVDLGAEMRRAQADLAGDELRRLSQRRRHVVAALGDDARRLGRDRGRPVSEASARDLEATLEAALADPGAADALRQGRLTTALHYSGFGTAGLAPAGGGAAGPAGPSGGTVSEPARRRRPAAGGRARTGPGPGERIQSARRELRAAEATAARTEREAARQERQLRDARTGHDRIARQVASLERRLADLRDAADQAARDLDDAQQAREAASSDARDARDRVSRARKALDRLTERGG